MFRRLGAVSRTGDSQEGQKLGKTIVFEERTTRQIKWSIMSVLQVVFRHRDPKHARDRDRNSKVECTIDLRD